MPMYMCANCPVHDGDESRLGRPFEADAPKCPACGCDRNDPEVGHVVLDRVCVHFDPPHPKLRRRGQGKAACDLTPVGRPKPKRDGMHVMLTGVRDHVTCAACAETDVFKSDAESGDLLKASG